MTTRNSSFGSSAPSADRFVCPACHGRLIAHRDLLLCRSCERDYPLVDGVPYLVLDDELDAAALEAIADWDELAPDYRAFAARLGAARFAPIDRPLLARARGDVLEVGCGDGRLLDQIDRARVHSLLGIDLSPVMTAEAARRGHCVVTAAAERLPLPNESVDVVLSGFYSLRYADLAASFGEIARVLRPGGQFGLTLQGRRAVDLASRAAGLSVLSTGDIRRALRLLAGRESAVMPGDVSSADALRDCLAGHGLVLDQLVGVPYLPGLTHLLQRVTGGCLPYVRGALAALVARDLVLLGHRGA